MKRIRITCSDHMTDSSSSDDETPLNDHRARPKKRFVKEILFPHSDNMKRREHDDQRSDRVIRGLKEKGGLPRGVSRTQHGGWRARYWDRNKKKQIHLGTFGTVEGAASAYEKNRLRLELQQKRMIRKRRNRVNGPSVSAGVVVGGDGEGSSVVNGVYGGDGMKKQHQPCVGISSAGDDNLVTTDASKASELDSVVFDAPNGLEVDEDERELIDLDVNDSTVVEAGDAMIVETVKGSDMVNEDVREESDANVGSQGTSESSDGCEQSWPVNVEVVDMYGRLLPEYSWLDEELWFCKPGEEEEEETNTATSTLRYQHEFDWYYQSLNESKPCRA